MRQLSTGTSVLALLGLLVGCSHTSSSARPFAKNVPYMALQQDLKPGTSIGTVEEQACRTKIFGIPLGSHPTVEKIKSKIVEKNQARYLAMVNTSVSSSNYVVYGADCITLRGEAYK
jgi:hypothetical protein